jgi:ABC-type transport system substrate-binding protein
VPGRRIARFVALAATVALLAVACTDDDGADPDEVTVPSVAAGVLRLGVFELDTFDPAEVVPTEQVEMIAADLLFDSLTVLPTAASDGDELVVEPLLAESLEPDAEHRVWTVTLAERSFSDGSPVTAGDVESSLVRVAAKGSESLAAARLDVIDDVEVVDDTTLEITLRDPFVELPALLSSPLYGIVPAEADDTEGFWDEPVGSGPFRFAGRDGGSVRLERVEAPDGLEVGAGGVTTVELVELGSRDDAYRAFVDGRVDWALVPSSELREATNEYTGDEFEFFGADLWLGFDLRDPQYDEVRLRWAIVRAVNSDEVVGEALPGRWTLRGMVPRGVPGRRADPCHGLCEHDPDEARRLLADAYPDGDVPTVTLQGYDDAEQRRMLDVVAGQLEEVGIPTEVEVRPLEQYREFVASGDGEQGVFSFGWVGLVPLQDSYLGPPFESGAPDNVTGLADDGVDDLIASARASTDAGERRDTYHELERLLLERAVVVPIAQARTNQVIGPRVSGWETRLDGTFVVDSVRLAGE